MNGGREGNLLEGYRDVSWNPKAQSLLMQDQTKKLESYQGRRCPLSVPSHLQTCDNRSPSQMVGCRHVRGLRSQS